MVLIAPVIIGVVLFFWFAFCLTIWAWFKTITYLCECKFIRAALWCNVGTAMVLWWTDRWESWDAFWPGAAFFTGIGVLGTFLRYYLKWRKSRPAIPAPAWPTPTAANDNQLINISVIREG